ncbi:MAG: GNAT family N-acetyltransferase [Ferruginibacter sp.]
MYGLPNGCAWIIYDEELPIACVGIRLFSTTVAELKRMYVNPDYRRRGLAQQLMEVSLKFAKQAGYQIVRLDTLCTMIPAMTLYRKNGFMEISAYYHNPIETAVYFEKIL